MPGILKKTFCLAVIFLLCTNAKGQIVGGSEAEEGTMKFLVKLEITRRLEINDLDYFETICAGTILDLQLNWVLTAGHCLATRETLDEGVWITTAFKKVRIIAGVKNTGTVENRQIREVSYTDGRVFIHPDQGKYYGNLYDAALIKLPKPFDRSPTVNHVTVLRMDTMSIDFNQMIERGMSCVIQSWGANALVPDGDKWVFDYDPPVAKLADAKVAMQGRLMLYKHVNATGKFASSSGDRRPPITASGDSGAPVLCAHGQQDPLHAGESGQGVMFYIHTDGFCHKANLFLREKYKGYPDCGFGTDVRKIHDWILKTFSDNPSPQCRGEVCEDLPV